MKSKLSKMAYKRGFTLIELLVVTLIITILAAVALPQYQKVVKKAHGTEALVVLDALDKALTDYYLENSTYEGADSDRFSVTIPEGKHIRFIVGCTSADWEGVSWPRLQLATGTASTMLRLTDMEALYINSYWTPQGRTTRCVRSQFLTSTSKESCSDYFNCTTTPLEYHPFQSNVGSPARDIPAHYTGGECQIK